MTQPEPARDMTDRERILGYLSWLGSAVIVAGASLLASQLLFGWLW